MGGDSGVLPAASPDVSVPVLWISPELGALSAIPQGDV